MSVRYVQHKSGIGEIWEMVEWIRDYEWKVMAKMDKVDYHYLPKSEYIEVPAPEQWELIIALRSTSYPAMFCGGAMRARYDSSPGVNAWVIERLIKG